MSTTTETSPVATTLADGTRAVVVITESGKRFGQAIAFVKRLGGQFDPTGKVWIVKIHAGNGDIARRTLVSEHGNFTGYQVIDGAAWAARQQNGGR